MAYQVLSRKWRPQKFQDVVGQEHVTRSLQNAILKDRLGHAYILTGTRGIGKTSVARLFAKSLRCSERLDDANPCGQCQSCKEFDSNNSMNVFEIDGASNNSVDDIRELISSVQTLPTHGKYKIYIIDEVHMLSASAFNALLKTLEEPPEHVVFVLATTEPHKLLNTVLSRCQRFDFRNASIDSLVSHITKICEVENIEFENEQMKNTLAKLGDGSFRDTLSLLDQVLSFSQDSKIEESVFSEALGLAKISSIRNIVAATLTYNHADVSKLYRSVLSENVSVDNICSALVDYVFDVITNIDDLSGFEFQQSDLKKINNLGIDEVFWVYESLCRDLTWACEAISSEKTVEIVLLKHARRNEILGSAADSIEQVKKKPSEVSQPNHNQVQSSVSEATEQVGEEKASPKETDSLKELQKGLEEKSFKETKVELSKEINESQESSAQEDQSSEPSTGPGTEPNTEPNTEKEEKTSKALGPKLKDWPHFEEFLKVELPTIQAQLEQGNLLNDLTLSENQAKVTYAFNESAKLFYEHIAEGQGREKIEEKMCEYFEVDQATLEVVQLSDSESEDQNFVSKSDLREQERQAALESEEEGLRNHPIIQEAQKLFGAKVDKIKINEE